MDILNYLSPFEELPFDIVLHKVNRNFFGEEIINISSQRKIFDYLISPLDVVFLKVELDQVRNTDIGSGDIVIVERTQLRIDGMAVVKINGELCIREISHNREFMTIIREELVTLKEGIDFEFFGTITYILRSSEEEYLEMIGDELFKICG